MRHVLKLVLAVLTAAAMTGCTGASNAAAGGAAAGGAARTAAAGTVAPVIPCGQLASHDFSDVHDAPTVILSATRAVSGAVCQVTGYIAPQEQFQLTLPASGYTGQYLQQGCGGLCGEDYLGSAGSGSSGPKPSAGAASGDAASAASCTTVTAAVAAVRVLLGVSRGVRRDALAGFRLGSLCQVV